MSDPRDRLATDDPAPDPRQEPLGRLAESLGIELPPFRGPLTAFRSGGPDEPPEGPIFLGGDLHASYPDAEDRHGGGDLDASLDAATIILTDYQHEPAEATAVEGIWCLALRDELLDSAPYFSLWDTDGRLRHWLLLPPTRPMIGIAHLWLPRVQPPSSSPDLAGSGPDGPQSTS